MITCNKLAWRRLAAACFEYKARTSKTFLPFTRERNGTEMIEKHFEGRFTFETFLKSCSALSCKRSYQNLWKRILLKMFFNRCRVNEA